MKQKDMALVIFIVGFSAIISFFLSKTVISSPKNRQQKVDVVERIDSDFLTPKTDDKYFNSNAIDPTETIQIGNGSNNKPFGGQ